MYFNVEKAFEKIKNDWVDWSIKTNSERWVVAVSGGKDSTIVAALASNIFGKDNVIGVTLPCNGQKDIDDSMQVIDMFCGKHINIDIGDMFNNLLEKIENNAMDIHDDTRINIPPRLRMTATYAVAQTVNGIVLNTSNLTEDILGYCTLWGDTTGSYAPIQGLTVTEVLEIGEYIGIPENLLYKTPADGLQSETDEDRLGMKYSDVDKFIRYNIGSDVLKEKVIDRYLKNKFKLNMIHIDGYKFTEFPNFLRGVTH
jgi:NAD+ synthase